MTNRHAEADHDLVKTSFDAVLANSTQNGAYIDCFGFRRAALFVNMWTGSATTANWSLEESDTGSGSGTIVTGSGLASAIVASTADAGTYITNIDLSKRKRYLRVNAIGTGAAGNLSALLLLIEGQTIPPTQDNTVQSI